MAKRLSDFNNSSKQYTEFVIKKALFSTCKNEEIYHKIQQDVDEMSALFVEVSRYIHFVLMRKWKAGDFDEIKFADYYYHLMVKKKSKYIIDEDYAKFRKDLPFYNSAYRSNLFIDSANQYSVIFHNNIWMHAYSRLRRFFKKFTEDNTKIYNTLNYLFYDKDDNKNKEPDFDLLIHLIDELQWNGEKLSNLKNKKLYWSTGIKLFFNLQRFNERNNYRNFSMIPVFKHGAHHIRYDSFAFHSLLCSLKLYKGPWKTFDRAEYWEKYFKIPYAQSLSEKKFDYSLQTDGVSVSFLMRKPIVKLNTAKNSVKRKRTSAMRNENKEIEYYTNVNLEKIRSTEYANKIGLDPGLRLMYGGVRNGKPIKLKNSTYHHMSGFYSRKCKLKRFTSMCPENTKYSANSIEDLENYTQYELEIFLEKQMIFSQRKVTRLKLQKYICVEKTCHKLAKELVGPGNNGSTLICIGSTEISLGSPMRGYIRTPHRKFVRALREHKNVDVMLVNEYRTTKLCANCYFENKTSRSPHRYQFCPNCNTCWNRDVNAGVNILYLGQCIIAGIKKNENFCKSTTISGIAKNVCT